MARAPAVQQIEAAPEIDRLEGFAHPRETVTLFGHYDAERTLATSIASGRMHHAWLFTGPEGIGKATLAYKAAVSALAEPLERDALGETLAVAADTAAARQVRSLSHAGLLALRRQYNLKDKRFPQSISVDEVRRLRSFLGHSSGAWRVVIVDTADELNINAANALLKSLEEPPARTIFLLISSEPGRLLPTIRSRCRALALEPLNDDALKHAANQAMEAAGQTLPDGEALATLCQLSDGSVRRLLSLQAAGGLEFYEQIYALLSALPDVDWVKLHKLADTLSGAAAEVRFELFFDLLMAQIARLVRAGATGTGAPADIRLATRLATPARLATLAEVWETVAREKADVVALNLDRKTLILRTVSRLEATTR
ncbi:MAG: DNA polymerase III subunit delta' [Hyphomicrobiaceae bacterium]